MLINRKQAEDLRIAMSKFLRTYFPQFLYKGHGDHVGWWETDIESLLELSKPQGEAQRAAFRLIVHYPTNYGIPIHIEMFAEACYEWETMFEGYIPSIEALFDIFCFQLGISKCKQ